MQIGSDAEELGQSLPKRDVRIKFVYPSISDMNVAASEIGRDGPR